MLNLILRFFTKSKKITAATPKVGLAPFSPDQVIHSNLSVKRIYDQLIVPGDPNLEGKRQKLKERYDILLKDSPLKIEVKGKKLKGLKGSTATLTVIDDRILIVCDMTPYQDVHAFDLDGNHLWDIEGCLDERGESNYSFGDVSGIVKDPDGRNLLLTHFFPVSFATDLETGKGTRIWSITDDTDMK